MSGGQLLKMGTVMYLETFLEVPGELQKTIGARQDGDMIVTCNVLYVFNFF